MGQKSFISIVGGVMAVVAMLFVARMLYATYTTEVITRSMHQVQQDMIRRNEESNKRNQQQAQRQAQEQEQEQEQRAIEAEAKRAMELAQLEQEKRLTSPECRFWWQQDELTPTERTATKKRHYCTPQ